MKNIPVDFTIGINGNNMKPTYSNRETLLVKKQDFINADEIEIFMIDEEFVK